MSADDTENLEGSSIIDEDLDFEARLQSKLAAKAKSRSKVRKEPTQRYYLDPAELEANLREHVIMRGIDPTHPMSNKLGKNIQKIIKEYGEGGQFRGYWGGWKEEMHSRAQLHVCQYAHNYRINYVDTMEFFVRWLFRRKNHILRKWLELRNIDYDLFYKSLLEVKIKTPNGKTSKEKMGRKIFEHDFTKLNTLAVLEDLLIKEEGKQVELPTEPVYIQEEFKEQIFTLGNESIRLDFEDQVKRNPFNYITKYANNAFIAVIREENEILDNTSRYEEKKLYDADSFDEDNHGMEDRFTQLDEARLDWDANLY